MKRDAHLWRGTVPVSTMGSGRTGQAESSTLPWGFVLSDHYFVESVTNLLVP